MSKLLIYVGDPKVFYLSSGVTSLDPGDVIEVTESEAISLALYGDFSLIEDPNSSQEEE